MEKREHSFVADGDVDWYRLWKTVWWLLKKLRIKLPYDPAILLLGIYQKNFKIFILKDTCTPRSTAALFTAAKTWREPKHPSIEDWIKKMWSLHTREHYAAIRKDEILPFATTGMDLENIMLSEISQKRLRTI